MSSPLIFDTGALVALFNKQEEAIAREIEAHINAKPHSFRAVFEPNLVELFHWLVQREKLMTPKEVGTNLDAYGIVIMPVDTDYASKIHEVYFSLNYKAVFDYADFYMCAAALRYGQADILTVDRGDLANALGEAMRRLAPKGEFAQLVPFPR